MSSTESRRARIWDPLVRLLHWSLVGTFAAAWWTRHSPGGVHEWLGYAVLSVVALRLCWGFVGTRHARFAQFVRSPGATLAYARSLIRPNPPRYLGHNPLGAWMIVALIVTTLVICASGWLYTTDRYWGVEWVDNVHRRSTNFGLVLVALHIAGVIVTSIQERENLVASMIHGNKRPAAPDDVA